MSCLIIALLSLALIGCSSDPPIFLGQWGIQAETHIVITANFSEYGCGLDLDGDISCDTDFWSEEWVRGSALTIGDSLIESSVTHAYPVTISLTSPQHWETTYDNRGFYWTATPKVETMPGDHFDDFSTSHHIDCRLVFMGNKGKEIAATISPKAYKKLLAYWTLKKPILAQRSWTGTYSVLWDSLETL